MRMKKGEGKLRTEQKQGFFFRQYRRIKLDNYSIVVIIENGDNGTANVSNVLLQK